MTYGPLLGLRAVVLAAAFYVCGLGAIAARAAQYYDLTIAEPVSRCGLDRHPSSSVTVSGVTYRGYVEAGYDEVEKYATWRIPEGWSSFECRCGIKDGEDRRVPSVVSFLLDGYAVRFVSISEGESAQQVSFPICPGQSLQIRFGDRPACVIEPRFIRGGAPKPRSSPAPVEVPVSIPPPTAPADPPPEPAATPPRYSLDSAGLDRLAIALFRQCKAKPLAKHKVAKGRVAVSAFRTIGGCPTEIADIVAEDLSTAMIKSGFSLAERGQLDKMLLELKLQDTALVNPATAQRIGQLSGCNLVLLGSVSDQDSLVEVNVRLMETATGDSLAADRIVLRKTYPTSRQTDAASLRSIGECAALAFWNLVASRVP